MAEKVKVSREVAKELSQVKQRALTVHEIAVADSEDCLNRFGNLTFDELIRALYIGYEIEETPEQRLLELYKHYEKTSHSGTEESVIEEVLEILSIEIEGINK